MSMSWPYEGEIRRLFQDGWDKARDVFSPIDEVAVNVLNDKDLIWGTPEVNAAFRLLAGRPASLAEPDVSITDQVDPMPDFDGEGASSGRPKGSKRPYWPIDESIRRRRSPSPKSRRLYERGQVVIKRAVVKALPYFLECPSDSDGSSSSLSSSPTSSPPSIVKTNLSCDAKEFVPSSSSLATQPSHTITDFSASSFGLVVPFSRPPPSSRLMLSFRSFPVMPTLSTPTTTALITQRQMQLRLLTAQQKKRQFQDKCIYCLRIGQPKVNCETHSLRNPITKQIICPILSNNVCEKCGDPKSNDVHSTKECPLQ